MPVYELQNGVRFESQTPLNDDQLVSAAQALTNGGSAANTPETGTDNASVLGELGRSVEQGGATLGRAAADAGSGFNNFLFRLTGNPSFKSAGDKATSDAALLTKWMRDHPSAAPAAKDIHSLNDLGLFTANALGNAPPYIAAMLAGGAVGGPAGAVAAPALLGGAEGADEAGNATNFNPGAMLAGGALGAATSALPVPFAKLGGKSLIKSLLGGTAGGALAGAAQGATANIPGAIASGNPADALPSTDQIVNAAAGNAILGGTMGAALGLIGKGDSAPARIAANDGAKARLQDSIQTKADELGANLNNVKYGRSGSAESALESVQNDIAEGMKAQTNALHNMLDPQQSATVDEMVDKARIQGSLRSARNKLKGNVSEADINRLGKVVGQYKEGRILMDLMRQSNHLTNLFREGMKGGVSQITDTFNPLMRSGRESGSIANLIHSPRLGVAAGYALQPHLLIPGIGISLAGRGIDALTGQRSRVARFVNQKRGPTPELDMTGARSVVEDKAQQNTAAQQAQAQKDAVAKQRAQDDAAEQERLKVRQRQSLAQQRIENTPGLGGYYKVILDQTGIRPADASNGMLQLFKDDVVTPKELKAFHDDPQQLMAGNVGNHIIDALDRLARQGTVKRDPQWQQQSVPFAQPSPTQVGIGNPEAYRAQARGNQDRLTAAMTRIAASDLPSLTKQHLNATIAAIARTNNRQEATAIANTAVQSITDPQERTIAYQELAPLIAQIRHDTPQAAASATQ